MPEYLFDIFFSYKRDDLTDEWHNKVMNRLKFWILKELNTKNIKIFFDTESIETGEEWGKKIKNSLKKSKCLVAIWSTDYFHSQWCLSEWLSFVEREKKLGLEGRLIAPARFHDGEHFPEEAKKIQSEDFTEYSSTMEFFWKSQDGYEFEKKKLKPFAEKIAKKIKSAPKYSEKFPMVVISSDDIPPQANIKRIGS